MNPFVEWLVAIAVGIVIAIVGLFLAACAASYLNIWVAGIVLFLLFFGAIAGLYFLAERGAK